MIILIQNFTVLKNIPVKKVFRGVERQFGNIELGVRFVSERDHSHPHYLLHGVADDLVQVGIKGREGHVEVIEFLLLLLERCVQLFEVL